MKKCTAFLAAVFAALVIFGVYCRLGSRLKVEFVGAQITPASQMESLYANIRAAARRSEAGVEVFDTDLPASSADCRFVTLTYRLTNYGPLPCEWVTLQIYPETGDILQVLGSETDVGAFGQTDAQVTLLVKNGPFSGLRAAQISYYVLGRKIEFSFY